jgi:uncharacterized protein
MKKQFFITIVLLLTLSSSCGKKSKDGGKSDTIVDNSVITEEKTIYQNGIFEALKSDDLESFKEIIRKNIVDINSLNTNGNSLLIDSIILGSSKIRDYLLEKGANIDLANSEGFTPLMMATSINQIQTVQILINKGAILDKKNEFGDTALHIAIKKEYENIAIILIEAGANIKITDYDNLTAYDLTVSRDLPKLEELLKKLTLVEMAAPDLYTFQEIMTKGQISTLKDMLGKYPELISTYEVINPLCLAIKIEDSNLRLEMVQLLIDFKANPNGPLNASCIPLIEAVKKEDLNIAKILLENKAKAHALDEENLSPLIHAIKINNFELVSILVSYKSLLEYKFIAQDGEQEKIEACDVVRSVAKNLKKSTQRKTNKKIKKYLDCGFWDWLF